MVDGVRAADVAETVGEGADLKALALVDLVAEHLFVADDVGPAIAQLDVERNVLREGGAGQEERRKQGGEEESVGFHLRPSYFSSFGDRLEPWTATWQVVQFCQRGRVTLWVAGG